MARAVSRQGRLPLVTGREGNALLDREFSRSSHGQTGYCQHHYNEFKKCGSHKGNEEGKPYPQGIYIESEGRVNNTDYPQSISSPNLVSSANHFTSVFDFMVKNQCVDHRF